MIKNIYLVFIFFLSFALIVKAQDSKISEIYGVVQDSKGLPIPFATIKVDKTKISVICDANGTFLLRMPSNSKKLIISSVGYETLNLEITDFNKLNYQITLNGSGNLEEVVVTTAFGFKQKKKSLGYNIQEVQSAELKKGNENNFINALQGKVSGVNIISSGGAPGAGTDIIIRGITSLSPGANNSPLIVVDGIPVNNNTVAGSVLPSSGTNGNQAGSRDQFSFANRGLDINPEDIESISILKGAGATALYGLSAANGAIIITSKKGTAGKISLTFNTNYSIDQLTKFPEIQTRWQAGSNGRLPINNDGSLGTFFQSFGPPRLPTDPLFNNFKNAFDDGSRFNNTLTIQGGNAKTTYYSSISTLNQKGVVPFSSFDRYTFKLGGSQQVNDRLKLTATATLSLNTTISASQGDKGFMTALSYYSPSFDVRDYIYPDGSMKVFSPGIIDNPIYVARFSQLKSTVNRFLGNMGVNYKILPFLKFDYQLGIDMYSESRNRVVPGPRFPGDPTTFDLAAATGGFVVEERINYRDITSNAFLTFDKEIVNDLDLTVQVGNTLQHTYLDLVNARGERFALPGFYDISNTSNLFNSRFTSNRKYAGVFGSVKFGYKDGLFLELTGRNDWSSTLPKANNSFFYPSVSVSYVFSELHKIKSEAFSYGKFRISYAEVGKDAPVYSNGPYFNLAPGFPFGTIPGFVRSSDYADPKLKPERQKSFEVGTELKFINDRIGIELTYYSSDNIDQIIPVPIAYTSGYSSYITNAGSIKNTGIEIQLNATPIKTKNFTWDLYVNWFSNKSQVTSIKDGINEIIFYDEGRISNKLVVGGSAGDLYGITYLRNTDGKVIVRADGYPDVVSTSVFSKVGNAFPDWIGSINNSFSFYNFTISFLLEYKQGGKVFDVTMRNSIRNGVLQITDQRYQEVIFDGYKKLADGSLVKNDIKVVVDHNYYRNTNLFNNVADVILQDASWLRLRNFNITYNIPAKVFNKSQFIKSLALNATASNIILWTPFVGYDPQSNAFGSGYNVFGYTGSNIPSFSSYILGLNLGF
ncbi:MAG: SusC/RagA family TonB-linked outer membrane protein [Alphaproteobacteria bacterium]|nr:SusC/RagA family TonB-linked outer membrane protein [Alphaproteobacteria bacterium]